MSNDNKLIIDNDFVKLSHELQKFSHENKIKGIINKPNDINYESCNINEILDDNYLVMETGRYIENIKIL